MKNFKSYITEAPIDDWHVSWKKTFIEHILGNSAYFFISPAIIKHIIGEEIVMTFHTASIRSLGTLKAIQHTRKTISTMYDGIFSEHPIGGDVQNDSHTGFLASIKGQLVFGFPQDIMSVPDEKGIRGISLGAWSPSFYTDYLNAIESMIEDVALRRIKPIDPDMTYTGRGRVLSWIRIAKKDFTLTKLVASISAEIQHKYYKITKQFIVDNKHEIGQYVTKQAMKNGDAYYNEILVSNFVIDKILLTSISHSKEEIDEVLNRTNLWQKVVNYDEWVSFTKGGHGITQERVYMNTISKDFMNERRKSFYGEEV